MVKGFDDEVMAEVMARISGLGFFLFRLPIGGTPPFSVGFKGRPFTIACSGVFLARSLTSWFPTPPSKQVITGHNLKGAKGRGPGKLLELTLRKTFRVKEDFGVW